MWMAEAKAKRDIPLKGWKIKKGETITITRGRNQKFALWAGDYIYDLHERYVTDIQVRVKEDQSFMHNKSKER